ncbi:AraC family transcriptional regulator N-terminal domain-containing protein [Paenibacillus sp. CGMCC 1.16610]|uniref:Transcription regulator HTH AraC N-terminal domain-containing protein n=1 Tax=Paenibacillus anseongense TaxID=2682845 RepID=A0ABW9UL32_9BACL|nr:AraC family transcriptional regulator N-terminal domain-containing protein [Paenibacillus sp. CGMCC 1.16610]MVQ39433.1 hypothetical protein [Paenibacillus anseongense]
MLTPALCLVLQGSKKLHMNKDVLFYRTGDFMVSLVDIPAISSYRYNASSLCLAQS